MIEQRINTVLTSIIIALDKQCRCVLSEETAPAAILWTDEKQQFMPLIERLRNDIPHFLTLGDYSPEKRVGPAIWLRGMVGRAFPEASWDENVIPIIYLPGFSRQQLRAVDDCPAELKPLAELQYRGTIWSQYNARDWTIAAFLQSDQGGLGLEVAGDQATLDALKNSIVKLADVLIKDLKNQRIDSSLLDNLVHPDFIRSVLLWLNDPEKVREGWSAAEWEAFCNKCKQKLTFDPERDGELIAGEKLGNNEGDWYSIWNRFAEAPSQYPNIKELLRKSRPSEITYDLFSTASSWPQDNESGENSLRFELAELEDKTPEVARRKIHELESKHNLRRESVWAKLGEAPLAESLTYLNVIAKQTSTPITGQHALDVITSYTSTNWQVDAAVLQALDKARQPDDSKVVKTAIRSIYKDWLEKTTETFQAEIRKTGYPPKFETLLKPELTPGTCFLFIDGLRFDIGQLLSKHLADRGYEMTSEGALSAFPTVTATSKIAVSPIAYKLSESSGRDDFVAMTAEQKPVDHNRFKKLLEEDGIQFLKTNDGGDPSGIAWTECGEFDHIGHNQQWKIAWRINEEIEVVTNRIQALISAGWKRIEIFTDHGWLMLPGGLPKIELKNYLADTRWRRCAKLKETSQTDFQTLPWFWNIDTHIALAPGIHMFVDGADYAHGGLSLQECVIPHLTISLTQSVALASIESAKWVRLKCRVIVKDGVNLKLDIRTKVADESTSIMPEGSDPVEINEDGEATLFVENPDLEGQSATIVLLNENGHVISKLPTNVGG
jgi:hypothetical protein